MQMKAVQASWAAAVWVTTVAAGMGSAGAAPGDPEVAPCDIQQLAVTGGPPQAGAGHRAIQLHFTLLPDISPCQLKDYPMVDAVVPAGGPILAKPTPSGYMGGAEPFKTLILDPARGAHATVEWAASGDSACATYGSAPTEVHLHVVPPGTWQIFDIPVSIGPNEGLCNLQIHPLALD
jgi:Protein of unknown function (DUF4232)